MTTGNDILSTALKHIGEKYILGSIAPKNNSDWKGPWGSADFVSWCLYQVSQKLYGCNDNQTSPERADSITKYWNRDAETTGQITTVGEAAGTPGAVLIRSSVSGRTGHCVISDGRNGTVEAHSLNRGVIRSTINGRRWDYGILIPWIEYTTQPIFPLNPPDFVYRLIEPFTHEVKIGEIQTELLHRGFDPGPIDNTFGYMTEAAVRACQLSLGLLVDGEVGRETAAALGIELDIELI